MTDHQRQEDAGKDPVAVTKTFEAMTRQEMDILHNFGASKSICLRTQAIIQNALMMAVETVVRERRNK